MRVCYEGMLAAPPVDLLASRWVIGPKTRKQGIAVILQVHVNRASAIEPPREPS